MISIPDSLSSAKLVMMSSAPAKSAGMPDTRLKIHPFMHSFVWNSLIDCPIQSWLQTQLWVRSFYVERNQYNNKIVQEPE